jgi:ABC-type nitrate/sulfonate/bicarbonate transport system permease component
MKETLAIGFIFGFGLGITLGYTISSNGWG